MLESYREFRARQRNKPTLRAPALRERANLPRPEDTARCFASTSIQRAGYWAGAGRRASLSNHRPGTARNWDMSSSTDTLRIDRLLLLALFIAPLGVAAPVAPGPFSIDEVTS
jgi:hypothetical protein